MAIRMSRSERVSGRSRIMRSMKSAEPPKTRSGMAMPQRPMAATAPWASAAATSAPRSARAMEPARGRVGEDGERDEQHVEQELLVAEAVVHDAEAGPLEAIEQA